MRCRVRWLPNKLYLNFLPVTTIAQFVGKSCNNLYHFHVYIAVVYNVQLKLSLKPSSARFAMLMFLKSSFLTLTSMFSFCILWFEYLHRLLLCWFLFHSKINILIGFCWPLIMFPFTFFYKTFHRNDYF